jgi:hypothetical protein
VSIGKNVEKRRECGGVVLLRDAAICLCEGLTVARFLALAAGKLPEPEIVWGVVRDIVRVSWSRRSGTFLCSSGTHRGIAG